MRLYRLDLVKEQELHLLIDLTLLQAETTIASSMIYD